MRSKNIFVSALLVSSGLIFASCSSSPNVDGLRTVTARVAGDGVGLGNQGMTSMALSTTTGSDTCDYTQPAISLSCVAVPLDGTASVVSTVNSEGECSLELALDKSYQFLLFQNNVQCAELTNCDSEHPTVIGKSEIDFDLGDLVSNGDLCPTNNPEDSIDSDDDGTVDADDNDDDGDDVDDRLEHDGDCDGLSDDSDANDDDDTELDGDDADDDNDGIVDAEDSDDHHAGNQDCLIGGKYVENAAAFVAAAAAAHDGRGWEAPNVKTMTIEMGENDLNNTMFFRDKATGSNNIVFEAGKPYIVTIDNIGGVKHEFVPNDFFRSVAFRKVQSAYAEVKAPYFYEVEVFAAKKIDLYFIPIIPGTFELACEIEGHTEAGMVGTITVTGSLPPPTSIQPVLSDVVDAPWIQNVESYTNSSNPIWSARQDVTFNMGENPDGTMFFAPATLPLTRGVAYKISLKNVGAEKHEFAAPLWLPTVAVRKVQDLAGEYKAPTLNEVEVLTTWPVAAERYADMYIVPLQVGSFEDLCEIPGHYALGMHGTVVVTAP